MKPLELHGVEKSDGTGNLGWSHAMIVSTAARVVQLITWLEQQLTNHFTVMIMYAQHENMSWQCS